MQVLTYPFDSSEILKNRKKIKKQLLQKNRARIKKNIAILGGSTTNDIASILELFCLIMILSLYSINQSMGNTGRMQCLIILS